MAALGAPAVLTLKGVRVDGLSSEHSTQRSGVPVRCPCVFDYVVLHPACRRDVLCILRPRRAALVSSRRVHGID